MLFTRPSYSIAGALTLACGMEVGELVVKYIYALTDLDGGLCGVYWVGEKLRFYWSC